MDWRDNGLWEMIIRDLEYRRILVLVDGDDGGDTLLLETIASSTAISSSGFMLIFTLARLTPVCFAFNPRLPIIVDHPLQASCSLQFSAWRWLRV